jgi:aryl-alcohol dehydrogenase-like predicted oxidoreductase
MDKDRLILGTANFGNKYGISGGLSKGECFDILDAAWDMGIRKIDTARTYGDAELIIGDHNKRWEVISKGDRANETLESDERLKGKLVAFLKHHSAANFRSPDGSSIYHPSEIDIDGAACNFPLNIIDQTFSTWQFWYHIKKIARSVFIQGQAWHVPPIFGIPFAHLCWNFVYNHWNVDMMVFGVDSVKQLEEILSIPQYEIDYSKIGTGEKWIR